MRTKPRFFVLLVSTLLVMALFPGIAFADEGNLTAGSANLTAQAGNPYPGNMNSNCTYAAWQKTKDILGIELPSWGNAYSWYSAASSAGYSIGTTPRANSIVCFKAASWNGGSGHVAFVSDYNASTSQIYKMEGNYNGTYHEGWAPAWESDMYGYIYLDSPSPVNHNPTIAFDSVDVSDGKVHVTGWAYDPDVVSQSTDVHVYLFQDGNPTCIGGATANVSRKDVDNALHVGEFHGFDATFATSLRGAVDVQVAAINVGEGSTIWSEKKSITVLEPKGDAISIAEGTYTIRSVLDASKALDIADASQANVANVMLHQWNGGDNQKFTLKAAGDGSYYIIAKHSNKAIEVTNALVANGANVAQYTQNQSVAQRWFFDKNSNGTYTLRQRNSGLAMDVANAQTANGTNIWQYTRNGSDAQMFYLVPVDVSKWSVALSASSMTYAGTALTPIVAANAGGVAMKLGTDYTVSYKNNVNSGTATVTVTGKGGFTGSKSATFKINPVSIAAASLTLSQSGYTYDGKAKTPGVTVKMDGEALKSGTDYTVSYKDNTAVGTATVTVTGEGNYTGSKSATFSIVAASSGSGSSSSAPEGSSDGNGGSATPPSEPGAVVAAALKMHRLYNPNSYEHFYTGDDAEAANLVSLGWKDEGFGWTAPASGEPVYRVYNPNNGGDHHYTKDAAERDTLVSVGWEDEGVGWYSADSSGAPVYREYNPNEVVRNHNYTADASEHGNLVGLGWNDEGVAWYGV